MAPEFKVASFYLLQEDDQSTGREFHGTLRYYLAENSTVGPWTGTGLIEWNDVDREFIDDQFANDRRPPIHVRRWDSQVVKAFCAGHQYIAGNKLEVALAGCEDFHTARG
jgi:hypothetical protein